MAWFNRKNGLLLLHSCLSWTVAILLLYFFRSYGIPEEFVDQSLLPSFPIWFFLILGFISGFFFTIEEMITDSPASRRYSFKLIILLKVMAALISTIAILFCFYLFIRFFSPDFSLDLDIFKESALRQFFSILFIYILIVSALLSFVRQVDQKFGSGVLWNMIRGKYHQPIEEERVFMFIDLKGSTTIAEEMGHLKFSRMLQDCFYDLNDIFPKFKASVYQYVGDEAILTWYPGNGLKNLNCLKCFYAFIDRLENQKEYYLKNYGMFPIFKAGAHFGTVTTAEIGVVKKEIAYHGDVMNTTARIQALCNVYDEQFLISGALLRKLPHTIGYESNLLGKLKLKGKKKARTVYAINRAGSKQKKLSEAAKF